MPTSMASLRALHEGAVPSARVSMYKVCWVSFGCSDMDILAAYEAAIHDGVDVISISIGGGGPSYAEDSIAVGAFHAMKKGIIIVASAGNDRPSLRSIVNHAPWLVTVSASGIDRQFISKVHLGNGKDISGIGVSIFNPKKTMYPLVSGVDVAESSESKGNARFCLDGSLDPERVKGKNVFCRFGSWGTDSVIKGNGGVGTIVENDQYLDNAQIFMAPGTMVNSTIGESIDAYIHSARSPSAVMFKSEEAQRRAPYVASFSSRGPNPGSERILKPDIAAPGIDILSSYTLLKSLTGLEGDTQYSEFTLMSGTSMACPHVAGVAAYVKSFHPNWSQAAVRSAIMTTGNMMNRAFLLFLAFMATTRTALMETQTYIVHMDKAKVPTSDQQHYYEAVMDSITELSSQEDEEEGGKVSAPELLYIYNTAISGFAAKLSSNQLKALSQIHGFLYATPDELLTLHTTHSPQFLGLQQGKGLWSAPNLATDVIIGVVDTGVWPEHVSFKDKGMSSVPSHWKGTCEQGTKFSKSNCNKKLIGARSFPQGYEAIVGRVNETVDYRSPRDSEGHGTHTASTAGGNLVKQASLFGLAKGMASGMRYSSRIAAYKACWPLGCANSDVMAAIDSAVSDGVDILSLSLGGLSRPYFRDNIAVASFGAVQHGVTVSFSAGNSGPFRSSVSNTAPWMLTVAASYTDRTFPVVVKLGNGQTFEGSSLYSGKKIKELPLVYNRTAGGQGAEHCVDGSLDTKLVKGKIVACERGSHSRTEIGEQVKKAGGAGMILLNNEAEGEELLADAHILPATSLGASGSKVVRAYASSAKKPTALLVFQGTVYGKTAPVMAAFSSRGPSAVGPDVIKPDVTAPGVNILAAWPAKTSPTRLKSDKRKVLFNMVSGTSMSCPHVSGLAALIKSVHKDWSPAAIKSALMTTAYTLNNKGSPISDFGTNNSQPANPFAFGSGHVDPESAADPGLIYDITTEEYLLYLCSLNYTAPQIALFSSGISNFTCSSNSAVLQPGDLNYPSFSVVFKKASRKSSVTYKKTVTNVGAINPSTYAVQVQAPIGVSVTVEPRKLVFKKTGEKLSYKVRFVEMSTATNSSFGSLIWGSEKYRVRSAIAVTWV